MATIRRLFTAGSLQTKSKSPLLRFYSGGMERAQRPPGRAPQMRQDFEWWLSAESRHLRRRKRWTAGNYIFDALPKTAKNCFPGSVAKIHAWFFVKFVNHRRKRNRNKPVQRVAQDQKPASRMQMPVYQPETCHNQPETEKMA